MRCTLFICNLPPDTHAPALETLLARGETTTRKAGAEDTNDAWLCRLFGVAKQHDWPTAPLCAAYDGLEVGDSSWLHATPAFLQPDRSRLIFGGVPNDLTRAESDALIAALNQHFAQDGLALHAPKPQHWYLQFNAGSPASSPQNAGLPHVTTTAPEKVIGRNIEPYLPKDGALYWQRMLNEAQMILHAHPVNEHRAARGALPVNSVWLWGAGVLTQPNAGYDLVASDDVISAAFAHAAKTLHMPLPMDAPLWLASTRSKNALIALEPALDDASLIEHWCASLYAALKAKRISTLTLIAYNDDSVIEAGVTTKQARRWCFWWKCGAKPLTAYGA